jgi:hypothetical protein
MPGGVIVEIVNADVLAAPLTRHRKALLHMTTAIVLGLTVMALLCEGVARWRGSIGLEVFVTVLVFAIYGPLLTIFAGV